MNGRALAVICSMDCAANAYGPASVPGVTPILASGGSPGNPPDKVSQNTRGQPNKQGQPSTDALSGPGRPALRGRAHAASSSTNQIGARRPSTPIVPTSGQHKQLQALGGGLAVAGLRGRSEPPVKEARTGGRTGRCGARRAGRRAGQGTGHGKAAPRRRVSIQDTDV
jgi:hypothetical protein